MTDGDRTRVLRRPASRSRGRSSTGSSDSSATGSRVSSASGSRVSSASGSRVSSASGSSVSSRIKRLPLRAPRRRKRTPLSICVGDAIGYTTPAPAPAPIVETVSAEVTRGRRRRWPWALLLATALAALTGLWLRSELPIPDAVPLSVMAIEAQLPLAPGPRSATTIPVPVVPIVTPIPAVVTKPIPLRCHPSVRHVDPSGAACAE